MNNADRFPVYRSRRHDHSLTVFALRSNSDSSLQNDFVDFMTKKDPCLNRLVDMLINDKLSSHRFADPSFPF